MYNFSFFEKTLIEVCSPHLYASSGTFCSQIGQLFETHWVFEVCLEIDKSLLSKENVCDFAILPNVQRLTVPRLIDQFGRKRCQKKRKDVDYQLIKEFFQKYFVVHEWLMVKNSFSTYNVLHTYVMTWTVYFDWICSAKMIYHS